MKKSLNNQAVDRRFLSEDAYRWDTSEEENIWLNLGQWANITRYMYDEKNQIETKELPNGVEKWSYTFDAANQLTEVVKKKANTRDYVWSQRGSAQRNLNSGGLDMEIFEKLQDINKRPGMYLGRNSLDLLKAYMDGYISAYQELNCNLDLSFFSDFQIYIQDYYRVLSSHGWANIIRFYSVDDREAFDLFYVHLEKFINIRESNRPT